MKTIQPLNLNENHFEVSGETISVKFPEIASPENKKSFLTLDDANSLKELLALSKELQEQTHDYNHMGDENNTVVLEEKFFPLPIIDTRIRVIEITEDLDLRHHSIHLPNVKIICKKSNGSYPKVILGGDSNKSWNPEQSIGTVLAEDFNYRTMQPSRTLSIVEIIGAKNQRISIKQAEKIHLKFIDDSASRSIGYNTFNFNFVQSLVIGNPDDDVKFWCNENKFFIDRIFSLRVQGKYNHNNNQFYGGSYDYKESEIIFDSGRYNVLKDVRLEEIVNIKFGPQTSNNTIETSWHSSIQKSFQYGLRNYTLEDTGSLNRIIPSIVNKSLAQRVSLKIGGLQRTQNWNEIYSSKYFDIESFKDLIIFEWDNKDSRYLITCYCYDENGVLVKPDNFETPFLSWNAQNNRLQGNYNGGQIYGSRYLIIKDPRVKYLRVGINNNNQIGPNSTKFSVDVYSETPRYIGTKEDFGFTV